MKFIFCSEPFYPNKPDYAYEKEAKSAIENGFEIELFSFEDLTENNLLKAFGRIKPYENSETAIYRGWMLKPKHYEILYNELKAKNLLLMNTPEEYRHCHHFSESYEVIKDYTPKSVCLPYDDNFSFEKLHESLPLFGEKPLILKDYVKSRKHEWNETCFIESASNRENVEKITNRFLELQGEDLNEGLVFREFIEFQPLTNHSKSGMPLTKEFRLFFLEGELVFTSEYWEEGEYEETDLPKEFFTEIAKKVKNNFFTMDIAQKTDGDWLIIELGDGQVAGLPENADEESFYQSFNFHPYNLWRQDDNGHQFLIETFPCRADAVNAMKEFEARLHKQTYWIEKV